MMNYTYNENMVLADVENKTYGELPDVLLVFNKSDRKLCFIDAFDQWSKTYNLFYTGDDFKIFPCNKDDMYRADTENLYYVEGNRDFSPKMKSVFN